MLTDELTLLIQGINQQRLQELIQATTLNQETLVDSEAIESLKYDPSIMSVEVEFTNGDVYQYLNISPALYDRWLNAPSIGIFFNKVIKMGFYPYIRIA